jgi:hypothetical protein
MSIMPITMKRSLRVLDVRSRTRLMWARPAVVLASMLVAGGCASGGGARTVAPEELPAGDTCRGVEGVKLPLAEAERVRDGLPKSAWIADVGAGTTRDDAILAAKREAAAQVKSDLAASIQSFQASMERRGIPVLTQRIVSEVTLRVDTQYAAYFELRGTFCGPSGWAAVVAADRAALDRALAVEAERPIAQLKAQWSRIESAAHWLDAAPGFCLATGLEQSLDALEMQRLAISGNRIWTPALLDARAKLYSLRDTAKAAMRVAVESASSSTGVELSPATVAGAPDATTFLMAGLRDRGWIAGGGTSAGCAPSVVLAIRAATKADCHRTSLGVHECKAWVEWQGRRCDAGELVVFTARTDESVSYHSQQAQHALMRAVQGIRVEGNRAALMKQVLGTIGECSASGS